MKSRVDVIVAVNDGKVYNSNIPGIKKINFIQHQENKGVGVSKNEALKYLYDLGCEHIFLIEDDIIIKDPEVYYRYIDLAKESGIKHKIRNLIQEL